MKIMKEKEIEKLLFENPDKLVGLLEKEGLDSNEIKKKVDLGRTLVQKRYKMNDDDICAVEFCFWLAYFAEREVQNMIIIPEVNVGARKEAMQTIIDKLSFGNKIAIISDLYVKNPNKDNFVKFLRKINKLRNATAHGRFSELKYDSHHLSDLKGQLKIVVDFMKVALNKDKTEEKNQKID